jgi:hypothetical protein
MKKNELEGGQIYWFKFTSDQVYIARMKYDGDDVISHYIRPSEKLYKNVMSGSSTMNSAIDTCRLATLEEKLWLEKCMENGIYVPDPAVVSNCDEYSVY